MVPGLHHALVHSISVMHWKGDIAARIIRCPMLPPLKLCCANSVVSRNAGREKARSCWLCKTTLAPKPKEAVWIRVLLYFPRAKDHWKCACLVSLLTSRKSPPGLEEPFGSIAILWGCSYVPKSITFVIVKLKLIANQMLHYNCSL